MSRTKVAVACRSRAERAAITEWLDGGGYQVMPVFDPGVPARDLETLAFEVLIIESVQMPTPD